MAAPSGTIWGSVIKGSSNPDGRQGKIGIYVKKTDYSGQSEIEVQVWFASKYSVTDDSNNFYFDVGKSVTSATTRRRSVVIKHTVATGEGWSTSNQTLLFSDILYYNRGTSNTTYKICAKFSDIDILSGSMLVNTSFTVPKLATYTVSYNANGGSGAPSSQTKYNGTSLTLSTAKPTRTGYTFQGWATSTNGSVAYASGANYTENASVILYAVWKANTYTVSYNANGGSGAPSSQTKTHGTTLKLSTTIPTRTNYTFKGWATSAAATTAQYAAGANYTANSAVTLYSVWELAYVAPVISNLIINRYDSEGMVDSDTGTSAMISFSWKTNHANPTVLLECEENGYSKSFSCTDNSGVFEQLVDHNFDSEKTYTIKITVTDSGGNSVIFGTLLGTEYSLDFLEGGKGASFGKPSEKVYDANGNAIPLLDIAWKTRHFGGILPVVLEPETNLDDVLTPNTYIGHNISSYNYVNCPVESGTFTLLVESCGDENQVKQTYCSCSKYKPERYSRFYYQGSWGEWFWANTDEYVLYKNDSGSSETVTLSAALSHFRYIEIYFTDNNDKTGGYTKVYKPEGKVAELNIVEAASTIYNRQTAYALSGTTMTPDITNASYVRFSSEGVAVSKGKNYIKIVRVIGRA